MSSRIPEDLVVNLNSSSIVLNKDYETSKRNFLNTQLGSLGLFGEDDAGGESDVKNMFKDEEASRASIQTTKSIKNLSFDDFIERLLKDSENKPVNSAIKNFIMSTTGPNGDGSPPDSGENVHTGKLSYEFKGILDLPMRYSQFTEDLINYMGTLDQWSQIVDDEDELMVVQGHVETYILGFLADLAYKSVQSDKEDEELLHKMKVLSAFIEPEVL